MAYQPIWGYFIPRLENHVHCMFILTFFVKLFFQSFFLHTVIGDKLIVIIFIIFKHIYVVLSIPI